jgi:retinol dehydrogenase-12
MRRLVSGSKEDEYATCTLLYAGLAPEVRSGDWVVPWGRKGDVPENVRDGTTAPEGDESVSTRIFGWYEAEVEQYM